MRLGFYFRARTVAQAALRPPVATPAPAARSATSTPATRVPPPPTSIDDFVAAARSAGAI